MSTLLSRPCLRVSFSVHQVESNKMFSSNFWENDFVSQTGFDSIVSRMKEGRQTCRDVEDFLKQRAKAEEDFARALQKIARSERATGESGSLKASIEVLRSEAEIEASLHSKHAQYLSEEANKLADFREKQREERKRYEDAMHKIHKIKADSFRKLQSCKSTYENKFRAAEKADSDYERVKFSTKPREVEKAKKNQQQSRLACDKADEDYKASVEQLEMNRQTWVQEHRNVCEIFQRLEEERLQYLRNGLWVYANLGSDLFVESDDSRERMRLSLEKCDVSGDLKEFVTKKGTGTKPLDPMPYIPCGGITPSMNHQPPSAVNNSTIGRQRIQDEYSLAANDTYSSISVTNSRRQAMYDYTPQRPDEMKIQAGDQLSIIEDLNDGWLMGKNIRTGIQGLIPANYVTAE